MRKTDRNEPVNSKSGFSFMSGFLAGLSVLTKPFDYRYTPPLRDDASVATAWRAVGGYMRTAMMGCDRKICRQAYGERNDP